MTIERTVESGFAAVTLVCARMRATFVPSLNMLCCSLIADGDELLHLRAGIAAYAQTGKTCGIPFLHPWANRLASDSYTIDGKRVTLAETGRPLTRDANGLPNHGLLGGPSTWEIVEEATSAGEAAIVARFDFADEALLRNFPFPHELRMRAALDGDGLTITTTLTPTSRARVPVSFGYHPYFTLPRAARESWLVTLPVGRRLVLDERQLPTGRTEPAHVASGPLADRTFDDAFTDVAPPRTFLIEGGGRRIEVVFDEAYPFAQIYAPASSAFLCIEPMTAPANALVSGGETLPFAQPGSAFHATFRIRVSNV